MEGIPDIPALRVPEHEAPFSSAATSEPMGLPASAATLQPEPLQTTGPSPPDAEPTSPKVQEAAPGPLGISMNAILPFAAFFQERAANKLSQQDNQGIARFDPRVGRPKIELAAAFRADLSRKFAGKLPTTSAELTALGLDGLKRLGEALWILPEPDKADELQAWVDALRAPAKTTADICHFAIVKPDTAPVDAVDKAPVSCSYVEKIQREPRPADRVDDSGRALVGPATHFVSHAWCYDFELFCLVLYQFWNEMAKTDRLKCYFWIDIFCVDQHKAASGYYDSAFWEAEFQSMVRQIGHTVCIVMPWQHPICVTRIWCLWEIFSTIINDIKLTLAMTYQESTSLHQAVIEDFDGTISAFLSIDAANAEATDPADLRHIGGMIEASKGGFAELNSVVRTALLSRFVAFLAWAGDSERVTTLLRDHPSVNLEMPVDIRSTRHRAFTPLQHACKNGHVDVVRILLQHKADPRVIIPDPGWTSLHIAAIFGHLEVAQVLVEEAHCDPFADLDLRGFSPAHEAAVLGRLDILCYFLDSKIESSDHDGLGRTSTSAAGLQRTSSDGQTLLFCCDDSEGVQTGYTYLEGEMADFEDWNLRTDGPQQYKGDSAGNLWDEAAILAARAKTAEFLRSRGVASASPGQLLGAACRRGDFRSVAEMLNGDSNLLQQINVPFKSSGKGDTGTTNTRPALMQVVGVRSTPISLDHVKVAELLLDRGADAGFADHIRRFDIGGVSRPEGYDGHLDGQNALHHLRLSPSLRPENFQTAEPSMQMDDGVLPDMARLLIAKGGLDIEARDNKYGDGTGMTALHYFASHHKPELVRLMVEAGSDLSSKVIGGPRDGLTALGMAEFGDYQMGPTQAARRQAVVDYLRSVGAPGGRDVPAEEFQQQDIGVDALVAMGFDADAATKALEIAEGDAQLAMDRLLGGGFL